jgi:hypothetical protein
MRTQRSRNSGGYFEGLDMDKTPSSRIK